MVRLLSIKMLVLSSVVAAAEVCHLYSNTIESPCFTVVKEGSDYQIREYAGTQAEFWTNAAIPGDFRTAQMDGFNANFNYISGKNDMGIKVPMTAPVIFRKNGTDGWQVSFFVPSKFGSFSDIPKPQDPRISIVNFDRKLRVAVRVFSGFASEGDYAKNAEQLKASLQRDGLNQVASNAWSQTWAGYDSPFVFTNRHNEVWLQVAF